LILMPNFFVCSSARSTRIVFPSKSI